MDIDTEIAEHEAEIRSLRKRRYGAGLHNRYQVTDRVDGRHVQSKHCFVLILRPDHPADLEAAEHYATCCEVDRPDLAAGIRERLEEVIREAE